MHDIRLIREAPHAFDAALARRGLRAGVGGHPGARRDPPRPHRRRGAGARRPQRRQPRGRRGEGARRRGRVRAAARPGRRARRTRSAASRPRRPSADAALRDLLMGIPNLPYDDVPDGAGRDRQRRDPPLGQPAQLRAAAARAFRGARREGRPGLRGGRAAVRRALRGDARARWSGCTARWRSS